MFKFNDRIYDWETKVNSFKNSMSADSMTTANICRGRTIWYAF